MEKTKIVLKKRKFKRTSDRKLSLRDLAVLDFLWTYKVASFPMLKDVGYKNKSHWWAYKALMQLKNEKLIQALPRGKFIEQELWALTETGFEVVLMDRDDIEHYRYKPHAPAHDFLATCLQLGDYWQSDVSCVHFTEQMLSSLGKSNFPKNIQDTTGHIPDGLTVFSYSHRSFSVGYEVDLNLKDEDRYESTAEYYLQSKNRVSLIVWLVKNHWVYEKIHSVLTDKLKYEKEKVNERYAFILLEDFKKNIWNAKGVNGVFKDHTIQKLHANLLQSLGKAPPNLMQKDFSKIYFPIFKSPQKFMAYPEKELSI